MPTKYRGSQEEVRALNALITLARASDALEGSLQRELAGMGLTPSQFGIMEALFHLGPLCQGALAEKLLRCCGSMTSVVEGLERRGLVERRREPQAKRFVRVALTGEGRRLIGRIFPRHAKTVAAQFGALTAAEQEQLRLLCRKLGKAVSRG